MARFWFRPRRYGLGATPTTWQGWALIAGYLAAIFGLAAAMNVNVIAGAPKPPAFLIVVAAITAPVVWLVWRKTDGPWRWRWGGRD